MKILDDNLDHVDHVPATGSNGSKGSNGDFSHAPPSQNNHRNGVTTVISSVANSGSGNLFLPAPGTGSGSGDSGKLITECWRYPVDVYYQQMCWQRVELGVQDITAPTNFDSS